MTVNTELKIKPEKSVFNQKEKPLKKQKLRNNEYYDLQPTFDELHRKATNNHVFTDLLPIITKEDNILLAYRNIKKNDGSQTHGMDGLTIEHYKTWTEERFVKYFQDKLKNYHPKSVRRVEIPKEWQPGKTRPLGIPCMDDRIIQQCIKQVLEPICEAKFHNHSYGFRPNRGTNHAIARTLFLTNISKLHYVVDIDIKGFFDNVNHGKLLKQMWNIGIRDKNLLSIIGKILKSEIKGIGIPDKGTPQGGIISPLLSNIVLNELDWWLSDQWETIETNHKYSGNNSKYLALRRASNLKQFFFVRYADDFKIVCKDYKTAQKIFIATKQWLLERLGLEISPEKSKITNLRKSKTEFLGLSLFVKRKETKDNNSKKVEKFVTRSNISDKAIKTMCSNLKEQIKVIQNSSTYQQVNILNAMILGMHGYYKMATMCSRDFAHINYIVSKSLYNRLKRITKKVKGVKWRRKMPKAEKEVHMSKTYRKYYGKYEGRPRIIAKTAVFPIYGCTHTPPMNFTQGINNYTPQGRALVHNNLNKTDSLVKYLLKCKEYEKSVEYNDNRISLIAGQNGKCAVTGEPLEIGFMECHHKLPKSLGGTDVYENLMWVKSDVHSLIHATQPDTINKYMQRIVLDKKGLKKVNSLRLLAENLEIAVEKSA